MENTDNNDNTLFDRTFRNSEGKITIVQIPNLLIIIGVITSLLKMVVTTGKLHTGLDIISFGTLFTWAWEELFQGVNYVRRALGAVVLLGLIVDKLQ